ncbi:MAG: RagB/SusD family nutrient uptake outer membrane protein [Paludibacter sp.]|nr:RagB/SusD family nutrient uptake outer membrane protein [Paludibacter sp.]
MKKKLLYTIIIVLTFGFATSCTDLLQVSSVSMLTDKDVFTEPDSANQAIAAIYDIFGQNNSYRNRLWLQMGINTDIEYRSGWSYPASITLSKADDYFALYNANPSFTDGNYNDVGAANPWSRLYQGIERANLAIAGIRKYGSPVSGNDMGHLLGEALTLRAYFYYDLVKWWGDVPARFSPVDEATVYLPKSDRDTIYNHIINDLQEAVGLLYAPAANKYTLTTKRVSKDAARGLLARVCLSAAGYSMRPVTGTDGSEIKITASETRQKELYSIARSACRDIIADGKYALDPSFKNIFYEQCQDLDTHGREAIWQLPYLLGSRGRMLYNLGLPRESDSDLSNQLYNPQAISSIQFRIMPYFYYDYNVSDSRRDITIAPYKVVKSATIDSTMEQSVSSGVLGFTLAKWRAEWVKTPVSSQDDGVSPIVLRYADVLLMFAEADLFLNGTDGAEYLNMVRRRAFKQSLNAVSAFDLPLTLDNIKKERAFEFCGENIRKYDLERWGELKSSMDIAKAKLTALRDGTGEYVDVPATIYYKYTYVPYPTEKTKDTKIKGERVITFYGMQRGETEVKTTTDPTGGWIKKTWTQAKASAKDANGVSYETEYYLSDGFISSLYLGDPDKRQLLPIMGQIIGTSNGKLYNNYGYDK